MGVRLKRLLAPAAKLSAGEWSADTASGRPAVACPCCGAIDELAEPHRVSKGGVVSLVYACPGVSCPFMDFLSLDAFGEMS